MQLLRDNLTLWTSSDAADGEHAGEKKEETAAAATTAAAAPAEVATEDPKAE